jgi:hypothetical protein
MPIDFVLRFETAAIPYWADRYTSRQPEMERSKERLIEGEIAPSIRAVGYLTLSDLAEFGNWKAPRIVPRLWSNGSAFVEAVTEVALATPNEELGIKVLTLLNGVSWPVASVILHFTHKLHYPILDFRALWSVGINPPTSYDFPFWCAYTAFCRQVAEEHSLTMRQLDRALWQYSKENQPRASTKQRLGYGSL